MYLEDREEAYKLVKTIKEQFELCTAMSSRNDSFRHVCTRMFSKLNDESHKHLLDFFKEDLMQCGLLDENGYWKLVKINE